MFREFRLLPGKAVCGRTREYFGAGLAGEPAVRIVVAVVFLYV
ncbi:MAG: hypothetical protein QGF30_01740 [Alphaproteobacteria bacterium]|nr:hypothetical protein [Alphaproteobacteria bacterium]MDP6660243.1 hypothetical protein [Alphaproteobacteria bacterium]MDP6781370.1 hypothetical protein [Alphaproteobacteria bacterium]